jgi:Zn-dependent protease with chaperone function
MKVGAPSIQFDRQTGAYRLHSKAFAERYAEQVVDAVALSQGQSAPPTSALQGQALQTCYAVARQLLGPVQALALAGTAMAQLVGPEQAADLDEGMRTRMKARPVANLEGTSSQVYLGDQQETGYGASTSRSVILPEGFAPLLNQPLGAFLVGHELGHVEANDVIERFGRNQVVESLGEGPLAQEARQVLVDLDHQIEFDADQRGLRYALSQGHGREAVLQGFSKFLQVTDNGQSSDSHPSSQERLRRLAGS